MNNQAVQLNKIYDSVEFKQQFESYDGFLGLKKLDNKFVFRVWSPLSNRVEINIYNSGDTIDKDILAAFGMQTLGGGVWEIALDLSYGGKFYTYKYYTGSECCEGVDIYATCVGVNGNRGAILLAEEVHCEAFSHDTYIHNTTDNYNCPIIWETHIRDFSVNTDSGIKSKGKFLAFTEENTTTSKGVSSGIAHLKELGVSYVHLLPFYDFATVEEKGSGYNWGYDPKNFNALEGSYSINVFDPSCRVMELKQLVASLHRNGIGVIMDVVYNHTYAKTDSFFHKACKYYYHRIDEHGEFCNASGCGNEVATERKMVSKFIVESILYFAKTYHLDGFRFDLMALYDVETINEIRCRLNTEISPHVIMYGEPWAVHSGTVKGIAADKANVKKIDKNVAVFSDTIRDGIRGCHMKPDRGYGTGEDTGLRIKQVLCGLQGGIEAYGEDNFVHTAAPSQQIVYISAHDNYTLYDQIFASNGIKNWGDKHSMCEQKNILSAAIMFMCRGIVFMQAGEEFCRSKQGDENSYKSSDNINAIDYNLKLKFPEVYNYYRGLIELRKYFPPLTDLSAEGAVTIKFINSEIVKENNIIAMISENKNSSCPYSKMLAIFNPKPYSVDIDLNSEILLPREKWGVVANERLAGRNIIQYVNGNITLPPYSPLILVE